MEQVEIYLMRSENYNYSSYEIYMDFVRKHMCTVSLQFYTSVILTCEFIMKIFKNQFIGQLGGLD